MTVAYGAAQVAITSAPWLPIGWHGVELLLFLGVAKLVATALTIGSGGSAGDFGPSLVLGGLFGGAFGHAAAVLLHDPSIDPGAFALVGMGTFYGGLAHVPVSSLIMVCEMAGSYDLLVPLMLAEGIAFVALRKRYLYEAQVPTHDDSPVHQRPGPLEVLRSIRVENLMSHRPVHASFAPKTSAAEMARAFAHETWQTAFPVIDGDGVLVGVVGASSIAPIAPEMSAQALVVAADVMQPGAVLRPQDSVRRATELFLENDLQQLPVVGIDNRVVGFLDQVDVTRAHLEALAQALERATTSSMPAVSAVQGHERRD